MTAMAHEGLADSGVHDLGSHVVGARPRIGRHGAVADLVAYRSPEAPRIERPALSRREVEVLLAWLAADSKEDAAARLYISVSTVSTHISRIRQQICRRRQACAHQSAPAGPRAPGWLHHAR